MLTMLASASSSKGAREQTRYSYSSACGTSVGSTYHGVGLGSCRVGVWRGNVSCT